MSVVCFSDLIGTPPFNFLGSNRRTIIEMFSDVGNEIKQILSCITGNSRCGNISLKLNLNLKKMLKMKL